MLKLAVFLVLLPAFIEATPTKAPKRYIDCYSCHYGTDNSKIPPGVPMPGELNEFCVLDHISNNTVRTTTGSSCYCILLINPKGQTVTAVRGAFIQENVSPLTQLDVWKDYSHFTYRQCKTDLCNNTNNSSKVSVWALVFCLLFALGITLQQE